MVLRIVWLMVCSVLVAAAAGCRASSSTSKLAATAWTTRVSVQDDGDAEVEETIVAHFAGPATGFRRQVQANSDGLIFERAAIDDVATSLDPAAPAHVVVKAADRLDVTWTFPATFPANSDRTHTFTLAYRARHAVEINEGRGRLAWPAIPGGRSYAIDHAAASLTIPSGAVMYDPSGMAERGWSVTRLTSGITAERNQLAPNDAGTILAKFSLRTAGMTEAVWQLDADRAHEFGPAFLSAGVFIVVTGIGVLWILWFHHPRALPREDPRLVPGLLASRVERMAIARDLARAGWVTLVVAAVLAAVAYAIAARYGLSVYALSAGTAVDGVLFLVAARWFP